MEEGYVPDRAVGSRKMMEWFAGPAKKTLFGELRDPEGRHHHLVTYRCPQCALLEWYAPK
jgi:hypothetical protein